MDWRKDRLEVPREGYLYLFPYEAYNYQAINGGKHEVRFHDSSKLHLDFVNIYMIS